MIDIRQVCKVFLEFVYDTKMLPEEIIEILQNKENKPRYDALKWDFGEIMNIFSRNKDYAPPSRDDNLILSAIRSKIASKKSLFLSKDKFGAEKIEWLERHGIDKEQSFKKAIDYRNNFFHDVSNESGAKFFCMLLEEFITDAPVDEDKKEEYNEKIDECIDAEIRKLKKRMERQEENLKKIEEQNAQLQIALLSAQGKTTAIKEEVSFPTEKEKAKGFWKDLGLGLGPENSNFANIGTNDAHLKAYWISPKFENLNKDWYFVLRNEVEEQLKLLFVPANEISEELVRGKEMPAEQKKFDIFIKDDDYRDEAYGLSFEKYVCAIADFKERKISFPKDSILQEINILEK